MGNDVVGWILLALCVALVNSGTGLTALYVLLVAVAYCLLLVYAIRPAFMWVLRRSGSLQNGPSQSIVALTLLLVLMSSFFTSAIGIHAIFGAFMIGLICPHEGGFAVKIVEKLEDVISVLLLPLYFALSGLSTNIGLLDSGITWAYVVGVVAVAFFAKVIGGLLAARANGLVWRESATIGVLMSCKGLVELIVLNIGLQARILSTRTFTIFVVMALITTFATTPLTSLLYPESYQKKLDLWKRGKIDWNGNSLVSGDEDQDKDGQNVGDKTTVRRMLVYLRLDGLPSLFTFINLLGDHADTPKPERKQHHLLTKTPNEQDDATAKKPSASTRHLRRPLEVHGLRLMELTARDSSVMKVSEVDEYGPRDPVVKAFRTFGQFNDVAVAGDVAVVPERSYADTLIEKAEDLSSDFVLIPWSETGSMSEQPSLQALSRQGSHQNAGPYVSFLNDLFDRSSSNTNIGVFIDRPEATAGEERDNRALHRTTTGGISVYSGHGRPTATSHPHPLTYHIIVPYFGTNDDHFAVHLALQVAKNDSVTATIMHFRESSSSAAAAAAVLSPAETPTESSIAGTEADEKGASDSDDAIAFFTSLRDNLPATLSSRVLFQTHSLNLIGSTADIVAVINKTITATSSDSSIEHIVISSRSNSSIFNASANDVSNTANGNGTATVPPTPHTATSLPLQTPSRTLLSPMANALGMQAPSTPGGGHSAATGESRVLGGLGFALWEASRSGGLKAGLLVVQAKSKRQIARGREAGRVEAVIEA